tara:strand:- start:125 stop:409 length:285 start_codon:yes stop_codon:yes gene_type:complete
VKAVWNCSVLAESENTIVVEENHYFPPDSMKAEHFTDSETTTFRVWKGTANYYNAVVDGETNADAAWVYRAPKLEAEKIRDRVAFWKGVEVRET